MFAQTYKPSRCPAVVAQWKKELDTAGKGKVARLLGVPGEADMFPEWDESLRLEKEGHGQQSLIDVTEDDKTPASPEEDEEEDDDDEKTEEAAAAPLVETEA